jgi:hypothetical protein
MILKGAAGKRLTYRRTEFRDLVSRLLDDWSSSD